MVCAHHIMVKSFLFTRLLCYIMKFVLLTSLALIIITVTAVVNQTHLDYCTETNGGQILGTLMRCYKSSVFYICSLKKQCYRLTMHCCSPIPHPILCWNSGHIAGTSIKHCRWGSGMVWTTIVECAYDCLIKHHSCKFVLRLFFMIVVCTHVKGPITSSTQTSWVDPRHPNLKAN